MGGLGRAGKGQGGWLPVWRCGGGAARWGEASGGVGSGVVDEAESVQVVEEVYLAEVEEVEVEEEGREGRGGAGADLDDDRPCMQASGEGALAHHGDAGHLEHRRRRLAVVRDPQPLRRVGLPARVLPRLECRRRAPADLALLWNRKRVAAVGRTVLEDVLLVVLPLLGRPDVAHGLGEECKPAKPEHR